MPNCYHSSIPVPMHILWYYADSSGIDKNILEHEFAYVCLVMKTKKRARNWTSTRITLRDHTF